MRRVNIESNKNKSKTSSGLFFCRGFKYFSNGVKNSEEEIVVSKSWKQASGKAKMFIETFQFRKKKYFFHVFYFL